MKVNNAFSVKVSRSSFIVFDLDQLRQQLIFERKDFQAQINELQRQIDRLRRLSSTGSNKLRRDASEDLNLTSDDDDVDNLTFGRFKDYWARINANDFSGSEASLNSEPLV